MKQWKVKKTHFNWVQSQTYLRTWVQRLLVPSDLEYVMEVESGKALKHIRSNQYWKGMYILQTDPFNCHVRLAKYFLHGCGIYQRNQTGNLGHKRLLHFSHFNLPSSTY